MLMLSDLQSSTLQGLDNFTLPDGNGIELYWDRPQEEWPRTADGSQVAMYTRPLDLHGLLAEVDS